MRILVTGAGGFVGKYLVRELLTHNYDVVAFDLPSAYQHPFPVKTVSGDIQDRESVSNLVKECHPEACIHLSAISFVPKGWSNIQSMFAVNVIGTLNLLEALRTTAQRTRILAISSAEVYGKIARVGAVQENDFLHPENPYAISKVAVDELTLLYAKRYKMHTMIARPFNHIGPGQSSFFAIPSFAEQLAAIARSETPAILQVGNLDSTCDFADVRDVVQSYRLLIERGKAGCAYNIGTGRTASIRTVLNHLCTLAGVQPDIKIDPGRYRQATSDPLLDLARIKTDTNWAPKIKLEETLKNIMDSALHAHAPK